MDGTRASSISGCGSGEHGFVTRSQTRWAGSWRQKRIHGRSLPTGRRRRLLLKNRTNHAQDRERESPAQLQGWLLTSARARRLGPRWLKGGGRQKSAMEDRGTRPRLRVRTKSRGTGSADASRLHVRQERSRRWRPCAPPWPRLARCAHRRSTSGRSCLVRQGLLRFRPWEFRYWEFGATDASRGLEEAMPY